MVNKIIELLVSTNFDLKGYILNIFNTLMDLAPGTSAINQIFSRSAIPIYDVNTHLDIGESRKNKITAAIPIKMCNPILQI